MTTTLNTQTCDCGGTEFYFAKDLNLEPVWKRGNKYCRICADCGNRYFLAKSMYERVSDQYVILQGESEPIPLFECPACETEVSGTPEQCPYCDVEYDWGPEAAETVEAAPAEELQDAPEDDEPEEALEEETTDDVDDEPVEEDEAEAEAEPAVDEVEEAAEPDEDAEPEQLEEAA